MGRIYPNHRPHYYKGENGNKPYPMELMLRIFILKNLYDFVDIKVMNEVIDSRAFTSFCCISTPDEVPDGDTIGRFRNILVKNGLQEKDFRCCSGANCQALIDSEKRDNGGLHIY